MDSSLDERTERRLERFVGEWLTRSNVPGASVAVIEDGEPVYAGGFGSRELTDERAGNTGHAVRDRLLYQVVYDALDSHAGRRRGAFSRRPGHGLP
jgi:Beta-lactamase.